MRPSQPQDLSSPTRPDRGSLPGLVAPTFAVALVAAALVAAGCSDDPGLRIGDSCRAGLECASGFCYEEICLDPLADEDRDGLPNELEDLFGTNAYEADSDHDGADDLAEIVSLSQPADRDGDGLIDAVESRAADADADCLTDEFDNENEVPREQGPELLGKLCPAVGVCAQAAERRVRCEGGEVICYLAEVPGYEERELTCDGRDNDCDGRTDEEVRCDGEPPCREGICAGEQGCVLVPIDGPCDDGDPCTLGDRCEEGRCVASDDPSDRLACDDRNPCTADSCVSGLGCRREPVLGSCDDGDPCTDGDVCAAGRCAGQPILHDCETLGVDDDCDGAVDEDCPWHLRVRAIDSTGGTGGVACGAFLVRARIAPTIFHGPSTDGVFQLAPGLPSQHPLSARRMESNP